MFWSSKIQKFALFISKDMVPNMPHIHALAYHECEGCILGKMHRTPIPKDGSVTRTLQLIHSYICGPMWTPSIGGYYTPQQNGVAERKNQTLMEIARCMLKEKACRTNFGWRRLYMPTMYLTDA